MGTAISCTKCSQVAGLIQKLVETPRTSKAPSLCPAVLCAAVFCSKILCSDGLDMAKIDYLFSIMYWCLQPTV